MAGVFRAWGHPGRRGPEHGWAWLWLLDDQVGPPPIRQVDLYMFAGRQQPRLTTALEKGCRLDENAPGGRLTDRPVRGPVRAAGDISYHRPGWDGSVPASGTAAAAARQLQQRIGRHPRAARLRDAAFLFTFSFGPAFVSAASLAHHLQPAGTPYSGDSITMDTCMRIPPPLPRLQCVQRLEFTGTTSLASPVLRSFY